MIKQFTILALGLASLGGCNWGETPTPPPPKQERPPAADRPVQWLALDPECGGSLPRGEWLVCENKQLRELHRSLASQWSEKRQAAGQRELRVMRHQQEALLGERSLCEDAACVATAYRRYLSGYARPLPVGQPVVRPIAQPRPTWTPTPRKPAKPVRPHRPHGWEDGGWQPGRSRSGPSCAAEVGGSASAYLVRQCRVVNGRWDRSCTADRSCDDLRERIGEGCASGRSAPGFCNRR
ncbi:hypothetical protein [Sphingomonas sp.]|jgi:hypothetical protein|uniref:hypothetical protein n=1 Tax=Sphingomonas sp. TaxID=28214 RepID=UPI002EDB000C